MPVGLVSQSDFRQDVHFTLRRSTKLPSDAPAHPQVIIRCPVGRIQEVQSYAVHGMAGCYSVV